MAVLGIGRELVLRASECRIYAQCLYIYVQLCNSLCIKILNLQSEGHGIDNFQTMLSIGLGQEQQFT